MNSPVENTITAPNGKQYRYEKQYGNVRVTHQHDGSTWVPVNRKRWVNHLECWIESRPGY